MSASLFPNLLRSGGQVGGTISGGTTGTVINTAAGGAATGFGASLAGATASSAAITGAATFGIGAVVGIGLALWAAHNARVTGAKNENAAMNAILPAFRMAMQTIFDRLNAGQINPQVAVQSIAELEDQVTRAIYQHTTSAGEKMIPPTSAPRMTGQFWLQKCDKNCTVGCCLLYGVIKPAVFNCVALIANPTLAISADPTGGPNKPTAISLGGTTFIASTPSNKYGLVAQPIWSVHYLNFGKAVQAVQAGQNPVTSVATQPTQTLGQPSPTYGMSSPQSASKLPLYGAAALVGAKLLGFL